MTITKPAFTLVADNNEDCILLSGKQFSTYTESARLTSYGVSYQLAHIEHEDGSDSMLIEVFDNSQMTDIVCDDSVIYAPDRYVRIYEHKLAHDHLFQDNEFLLAMLAIVEQETVERRKANAAQ